MLRSMYAGVSGLRTHQQLLDVVGNNVANVNTPGYKTSVATFSEALTQVERGAAQPNEDRGGTNPVSIGLGTQVAGVSGVFTQGGSQSTGRATDLAIQGDGFFLVDNGGQSMYTRAGSFSFDANGTLVTPSGMRVQGWSADPATGEIDTNGALGEITVPFGDVLPGSATANVSFGGNLSADAAVGETRQASVIVYDSLGESHEVVLEFTKNAANDWTAQASVDGTAYSLTNNNVTFNGAGELTSPDTMTFSGYTPSNGADPLTFDFDLGSTTPLVQFGGPNSAGAVNQDGMGIGFLRDVAIGSDGVLVGRFSNGETSNLAAIGLATFTNNEGLSRVGESLYAETNNSGLPQVGTPGGGDRGALTPGALEMSNVDLAREFTTLIMAQRGLQANARTITTSDEVLNELINLKR